MICGPRLKLCSDCWKPECRFSTTVIECSNYWFDDWGGGSEGGSCSQSCRGNNGGSSNLGVGFDSTSLPP